jgi:hypothetical protein
MKRLFSAVVGIGMLLAGCSEQPKKASAGDVAASLYQERLTAPFGTYGAKQRCAVAKDAANAYLAEANSDGYNKFKSIQEKECASADEAQKVIDNMNRNVGDLDNAMNHL